MSAPDTIPARAYYAPDARREVCEKTLAFWSAKAQRTASLVVSWRDPNLALMVNNLIQETDLHDFDDALEALIEELRAHRPEPQADDDDDLDDYDWQERERAFWNR